MKDNRTDPQYKLRWPAEVRNKIVVAARENGRSINAEIIQRLTVSLAIDDLDDESRTPGPTAHPDDSVERLAALLNEASAIVSRYKKVLGEE